MQFDGLDTLINTNVTDLAGAALTLSAITTTMRNIVNAGGKPQAVIFSYRENQKFSELVLGSYYRLTQAGAGALADVPAGVAITRWVSPFGTVDIIGSRFVSYAYTATKAYVIDDKSMTNDGNAITMVKKFALNVFRNVIENILNFAISVKLLIKWHLIRTIPREVFVTP